MATAQRHKQLIDALQGDLHVLASEAKKKSPAVKLSAERALLRLRGIATGGDEHIAEGIARASDILSAFLVGLEETKMPKIVQLSIACVHRLIENDAIDPASFDRLLEALRKLNDDGLEEVRILQCLLSLVTSRRGVQSSHLASVVALCLQLQTTKEASTSTIAAATLRQIVALVFDRVTHADSLPEPPPRALADACALFEDICLLTNGEAAHLLKDLADLPRTVGLELIEAALSTSPELFARHPELTALVKERVCPLIIKLCPTPSKLNLKPIPLPFPPLIRVLRLISTVVRHYNTLLSAECEIFLNNMLQFLDADKPLWQRTAALEAINDMCVNPDLLLAVFQRYDAQIGSTKIFNKMVIGVSSFVQSLYQTSSAPERLVPALPAGSKAGLLDMLDKQESPAVTEPQALMFGFNAILSIVKSISSLVPALADSGDTPPASSGSPSIMAQLVDDAWGHILAALALLLGQSTLAQATESILRALQSFIRVCGTLHANAAREAFVSTLCTHCLPEQFSLGSDAPSQARSLQVLDKNLQCVHILFNTALCLGGILGTSWRPILAAMQELTSILDLPHPERVRPTHTRSNSGGQGVAVSPNTASELPALAYMLSQVFETSRHLSDEALQSLVQGLCLVSESTLVQVPTYGVGSIIFRHSAHLFPVHRILDVGLANLQRIMVFWPAVTAHLIEVASSPNTSLREAGTDALTKLVHAALSCPREPPIQDSPGLQQAILSPLRNLAACSSPDVHRRQLDCVHQVLDSCGQSLAHAWPVVIGIINDTVKVPNPALDAATLKLAFESIEMVVADFLPTVPLPCYLLLLETLGGFGLQRVAVNISLTSIGLLWNVTDYISRHHQRISADLAARPAEDGPFDCNGLPTHVSSKSLWMSLFQRLADLCVDPRPEVRKSASQTLFSTLSTHGSLFDDDTWHAFLWQILFPLLDRVKSASKVAAQAEPQRVPEGMLVHHSRDTAEKQWSETRVLALSGVARLFTSFHGPLCRLVDFPRAWALLLEFLQHSAQDPSAEVALAAAMGLQELFRASPRSENEAADIWAMAWQSWLQMAGSAPRREGASNAYIAALLDAVPLLYKFIHAGFTLADTRRLLAAVRALVCVPHQDALMASQMSDIQQGGLKAMQLLLPSEAYPSSDPAFIPLVLDELTIAISFACECPTPVDPARPRSRLVYVNMSLAAQDLILSTLTRFCDTPCVVYSKAVQRLLHVLSLPVTRKYQSPTLLFWRKSVHTAAGVVDLAVRGITAVATVEPSSPALAEIVEGFWTSVAAIFELAFFTPTQVPGDLSPDERVADAALDVELLNTLRLSVLPAATLENIGTVVLPTPHLVSMCDILKRGAVSGMRSLGDGIPESATHEEFARVCISTLLDCSVLSHPEGAGLGVSLVEDLSNLLSSFVADGAEAAKAPKRVREVVFAVRSAAALANVAHSSLAVLMYPALVQLVVSQSAEVRGPLRDALMLYTTLLKH